MKATRAPDPDRSLGPDDDVPLDEVYRWHNADRPDCPRRMLTFPSAELRCVTCGWWVELP
jgi:hypothetical protein